MIYIGNFLQVTNQQAASETERRHGEFSMIVEADNHEAAVESFTSRIKSYHESGDLFEGKCDIFFVQLLEFTDLQQNDAIMTAYTSYAGDPVMPFISCSIPGGEGGSCRIYDWTDNKLEIDGYSGKLFMSFEKSS